MVRQLRRRNCFKLAQLQRLQESRVSSYEVVELDRSRVATPSVARREVIEMRW